MELTIDQNKRPETSKKSKDWNDSMTQDFYSNYYHNLSSNELDKEFNRDIKLLTNVLSKLPESERKAFIQVLSRIIGFYIQNKIEKEIDRSIFEVLRF